MLTGMLQLFEEITAELVVSQSRFYWYSPSGCRTEMVKLVVGTCSVQVMTTSDPVRVEKSLAAVWAGIRTLL